LSSTPAGLKGLRNTDDCNALVAILLRTSHTAVSKGWIAAKLAMGHQITVSRVVSADRADKFKTSRLSSLESM
jgi:hypothetical protein